MIKISAKDTTILLIRTIFLQQFGLYGHIMSTPPVAPYCGYAKNGFIAEEIGKIG
jgi:hypothetical protein